MAHIVRLVAPSYWASYMINADSSSLEPEDIDMIDHWLDVQKLGYPISCEDAGFQWHHDAYTLLSQGADCQEYLFRIE